MGPVPAVTLLVVAKEPVPGRVKTRLTPPFTPEQAAALAEAALADTLDAVSRLAGRTGAGMVRPVLVLDGAPGPWLRVPVETVPQASGPFDVRLAAAFDTAAGSPALLIGMDTPQLTSNLLADACRQLASADAVFGPAADGGWWALGLRRADGRLLHGIATSRPDTGARQLDRLVRAGLRVAPLPVLRDVDTAADAEAAARLAPHGRFAGALQAIRASEAGEDCSRVAR
ncbi:glycosyltransferase [Protofrankia sp. BMG5.30]|nr:glycosyltransferase [Protofrankia sp. BMG5.30]